MVIRTVQGSFLECIGCLLFQQAAHCSILYKPALTYTSRYRNSTLCAIDVDMVCSVMMPMQKKCPQILTMVCCSHDAHPSRGGYDCQSHSKH